LTEHTPKRTLNEGHTHIIHRENLSKILGIDLYVKYEGANPTGSFKDRGMVMAVTKAKEQGKKIVICASTGNTSASAAAYAARAGLKAIVVIPEGKIALG
ncbi:pyridoxal-phosphate dependent enzyme, partial [Pseudomonas sp. MOB-449]|nr:pyridoxal-phosphate dependent enzyme [Pseudomonas sp. MOB-449]